MTTPFTLAQQAANIAYDMTLEATSDGAQASDAYKAVMQAYLDANTARGIANTANAPDVEAHEFHGVPLADVLREDEREEYTSATEGHW
jgi:hypothetical protein